MKNLHKYANTSKIVIAFLSLNALCMTANAGGAGSQFTGHADKVLKQSVGLYESIVKAFVIDENGVLGPLEQRMINGVLGRFYTFHEFTATHKSSKEKYTIRIHLKDEIANPKDIRSFDNRKIDRVEIIPMQIKTNSAEQAAP